jgi:hypothetical protein
MLIDLMLAIVTSGREHALNPVLRALPVAAQLMRMYGSPQWLIHRFDPHQVGEASDLQGPTSPTINSSMSHNDARRTVVSRDSDTNTSRTSHLTWLQRLILSGESSRISSNNNRASDHYSFCS